MHMEKSDFLSNSENKENFIKILGCHLEKNGHTVTYAAADADVDIVKCAVDKLDSQDVLVTADDTDILILIIHYMHVLKLEKNVFILRRKSSPKIINAKIILKNINKNVLDNILIIHAFSGCDTVSPLYGIGKTKLIKNFDKLKSMNPSIFLSSQVEKKKLLEVGAQIIIKSYDLNAKVEKSNLDDFRYKTYVKKVLRSRKTAVNLPSLPPTSDAANQHILRVYHQIQQWLGVDLEPEGYGWTHKDQRYEPMYRTKEICPKSIQKTLRCSCSKGKDFYISKCLF